MAENSNERPASSVAQASAPASSGTVPAPVKNATTPPDQNRIDESAVCENCGRTGAAEFGDQKLCIDCYQSRCSCCCESENDMQD